MREEITYFVFTKYVVFTLFLQATLDYLLFLDSVLFFINKSMSDNSLLYTAPTPI